jgi:hypothetical protein
LFACGATRIGPVAGHIPGFENCGLVAFVRFKRQNQSRNNRLSLELFQDRFFRASSRTFDVMRIMKSTPADLSANLADAAAALRAATRAYREALIGGDLIAAIRQKEKQLEAEVRLEQARWLIEGGDLE